MRAMMPFAFLAGLATPSSSRRSRAADLPAILSKPGPVPFVPWHWKQLDASKRPGGGGAADTATAALSMAANARLLLNIACTVTLQRGRLAHGSASPMQISGGLRGADPAVYNRWAGGNRLRQRTAQASGAGSSGSDITLVRIQSIGSANARRWTLASTRSTRCGQPGRGSAPSCLRTEGASVAITPWPLRHAHRARAAR